MSIRRGELVTDGRSHDDLSTGMETLVKFHTLLAVCMEFLNTGLESCMTLSIPKKGVLWKFSIGWKRTVGKW